MEIVYTPKGYRGFKSLLLRQKEIPVFVKNTGIILFCGEFWGNSEFWKGHNNYRFDTSGAVRIPPGNQNGNEMATELCGGGGVFRLFVGEEAGKCFSVCRDICLGQVSIDLAHGLIVGPAADLHGYLLGHIQVEG